jgi:hypothetical protein
MERIAWSLPGIVPARFKAMQAQARHLSSHAALCREASSAAGERDSRRFLFPAGKIPVFEPTIPKGWDEFMIDRISRNEIRHRVQAFVKDWENARDERRESQSFWDAFFHVFGKKRREVSEFERAVKKLGDRRGFIDLFWPGQLIVEQKSSGKDLEQAADQAFDYLSGLKTRGKAPVHSGFGFPEFRAATIWRHGPSTDSRSRNCRIGWNCSISSPDTNPARGPRKTRPISGPRNSWASSTTPWPKADTAVTIWNCSSSGFCFACSRRIPEFSTKPTVSRNTSRRKPARTEPTWAGT